MADVPTGLTASVSGATVTLTWTGDPANLATSYNVYASTDNGSTFTLIDSVGASEMADSLSGLAPDAVYVFQVTAVDASGETAPSNNTTPITSPVLPASPSDLTSNLSGGSVTLNWTGDSTGLATSYSVYASTVARRSA